MPQVNEFSWVKLLFFNFMAFFLFIIMLSFFFFNTFNFKISYHKNLLKFNFFI